MNIPATREISPRGRDSVQSRDREILQDILHGFRASQALSVVARLGVADHLAQGPLDGRAIAALTGTEPATLARVLRALCALGVFCESPDGRFSLSAAGQLLRSDVAGSYRSAVLLLIGETRWRCWASLLETVLTGTGAAERELGMQLFDFYAHHPAESKVHDDAMRALSQNAQAIVDAIDVGEARVIVDIGGGTGELLAAVLCTHPDLKGILFDLPDVVKRSHDVLSHYGVADRCSVEEGSFFACAPHGDLYLLKQVLHDWDDARAISILACCRRHMPPAGRLMVIERRMPEHAQAGVERDAFMTDLEMLVMTPGGRERTESEFRSIFAAAGFRHHRTSPTSSSLWVFEAHPV